MNEYRQLTIEDVCNRFSSGKSIKASEITTDGLYPVYGGNGIRGYTDKYNFDGECAVIGRQGAYCGNVKYHKGKAFMTEHAIVAAGNNENCTGYLYYKFKTMKLEQYQGQSAQPGLSVNTLLRVPVDIPNVNIQNKIFNTLNIIEEKIENNNKINNELESMAKTIYDYWFLQFEFPNEDGKPYKSSGGKMVWNEELKREIPEGWEVKKLEKLVITIDNRGKNPSYSDDITSHPIIDVATLRNDGRAINYSECSKYVSDNTYNNWFRAGHPQKGDILFSTVGSLAETKLYYPDDIILGSIAQNVIGLRTSDILWSYLYQILVIEKEKIIGYKIGSVQPSLKVGHVLEHKIIVPMENILKKYANIIEPINEMSYKTSKETRELTSLRDFLLPLLMNGQVGFKD